MALALVAGCAARRLPTRPALVYGSAGPAQLTLEERELHRSFVDALAAADVKAPVFADAALQAAARGLANRLLDGEPAGSVTAAELLLEHGEAGAWFRWATYTRGWNEGAPEGEDFKEFLETLGKPTRDLGVGVARAADGANGQVHWVVVAASRCVALDDVPRRWEQASRLTIAGRILKKVEAAELWWSNPDGSSHGRGLALAGDGGFRAEIELPASAGQGAFEIRGLWDGVEHLLAAAPIGVEAPVEPWPPALEVKAPASAAEIELAVDEALSNLRGRPFEGHVEVLETAKACAASLARGAACESGRPGDWARTLAYRGVELESVPALVRKLVALPSVRAVLRDPHVAYAGIAAQPEEGRPGRYALVIVLAGSAGPSIARLDGAVELAP